MAANRPESRFRIRAACVSLLFCATVISAAAAPQAQSGSGESPHLGAPGGAAASTKAAGTKAAGSANAAAPANGTYALVPIANLVGQTAPKSDDENKSGFAAVMAFLASLAWPVVAGIIVFRLLRAPQLEVILAYASRRVTQVSVAGVELKLSEGAQATLDDLQKLLSTVPETHQEWVKNTHVEDQFQLVISDLCKYLCTTSVAIPTPMDRQDFGGFRFTIHVPDVLLTHSLRQLNAYVGNDRGGGGRLFSSRRGIMGLAWRLQESQFQPHNAYTENELVQLWGMTRAEASDTKSGRTVFLAFVIRNDQGLPLALVYGDSADSKLFDAQRIGTQTPKAVFDDLDRKMEQICKARGLTQSLDQLEKVRITLKQVDVYAPHST